MAWLLFWLRHMDKVRMHALHATKLAATLHYGTGISAGICGPITPLRHYLWVLLILAGWEPPCQRTRCDRCLQAVSRRCELSGLRVGCPTCAHHMAPPMQLVNWAFRYPPPMLCGGLTVPSIHGPDFGFF